MAFLFVKIISKKHHLLESIGNQKSPSGLFFLLFSFLYLVFSFNFYKVNIDYFYSHRYASLALPMFYVGLVLLLYKLYLSLKVPSWWSQLTSTMFMVALIYPLQFSTFDTLRMRRYWGKYDGEKTFSQIARTAKPDSLVYCMSALWGHNYQYCSGVNHMVSNNSNLNIKYKGKKYFTSYELYPGYYGDWGPNLDEIKGDEFTFVFISDPKAVSRLNEYLKLYNSFIDYDAYQVTIKKKENLGLQIYYFLTQIKSFLDQYPEYEYRSQFSNFLERQRQILGLPELS